MEATLPAKRRQKAEFAAPIPDRLPPHSIEAEQGLLGCILLDSLNAVGVCDAAFRGRQVFYDERHKVIYRAAQHLAGEGDGFDLMMLRGHLKGRKQLDGIGGMEYLVEVENAAGSKAQLQHYLAIVLEQFDRREIIASCTEAVAKAYEFTGPVADLKAEVQADLAQTFDDASRVKCERFRVSELDCFDLDHDPDNLIGNRYLTRGGSLMINGPSGRGKSSLLMLRIILWALGRPFYGVKVVRPLTAIIFQTENNRGDLAQAFQGVRNFLNINAFDNSNEFETLERNIEFVFCPALSGQEFLRFAKNELTKKSYDLAVLDPLVSFPEGDLNSAQGAGDFLRHGLTPISFDTGVVWIINHHTPKPLRDPKGKASNKLASDYQYSGAGSFDIAGWARASETLYEHEDGKFRLVFAKRGGHGACHPNREPTIIVWLKHAFEGGIHWEQEQPEEFAEPEPNQPDDKPLTKPQQIAVLNLASFLSVCPPNGESKRDITRRLSKWLGSKDCPKKSLAASDGSIRNALELMLDNEKLKLVDGMYCKGPQA